MFRPLTVALANVAVVALLGTAVAGYLAQPDAAAQTPACVATDAASLDTIDTATSTRVQMPNGDTVTVTRAEWSAGAVFPAGSRVTAYCR